MKRLFGVLLALVSCASFAAGESGPATRVEASMVVTGTIIVNADGTVHSYALDRQNELPPVVVDVIRKTIAAWAFRPVLIEGKPVLAEAKMNLRIVASPLGNGRYDVRVRGETFGNGSSSEWVSPKERKPPQYPIAALQAAASGTVYVAVEVGRDGRVEQAIAQQVDLREVGFEPDMRALRRIFATQSIIAAKNWTFDPPTTGPEVNADHWTVRVPVNFNIMGRESRYGEWDPYVPGPITPIPWEQDQVVQGDSTDALPDGSAFAPDGRFVLLTAQGG